MSDFDIDLKDWDIESTHLADATKYVQKAIDEYTMKSQAISPTRAPGMRELGGFRIFKANNGFIIQVGRGDGYPLEDAYICREADEIGDLITAHIVRTSLER